MEPVPIPDARIWHGVDGAPLERITMGAPRGHEQTVAPLEVLVDDDRTGLGGHSYHALVRLDDRDLDALAADPHLWVTFWGAVVPFRVDLGAEPTPADDPDPDRHPAP